jgi:hypothetical protein
MGSGVRVILHNERHRGVVQWNTSEWRKDPDLMILIRAIVESKKLRQIEVVALVGR